jgi:hypothetical protein
MTKGYLLNDTRRTLNNMRAMLRRKYTTGWVQDRSVMNHYERALTNLMRLEGGYGLDDRDVVRLSNRLNDLYYEARRTGMLSDDAVLTAERRAFAAAEKAR